jgi:hypothetical protein
MDVDIGNKNLGRHHCFFYFLRRRDFREANVLAKYFDSILVL